MGVERKRLPRLYLVDEFHREHGRIREVEGDLHHALLRDDPMGEHVADEGLADQRENISLAFLVLDIELDR